MRKTIFILIISLIPFLSIASPDTRNTDNNKIFYLSKSWTKVLNAGQTLRWGYIVEGDNVAACITDNTVDEDFGRLISGYDSLQFTSADKDLFCRLITKNDYQTATLVMEIK